MSIRLSPSRISALLLGFLLAILMAVLPAAPATAQNKITWEDLQAQSTHLQNPYEHLSEDQTYRLSSLYKLREWSKEEPFDPDGIEAKEIQRLEQSFIKEGIDADALLVDADKARAYWQSQSQTTNADLEDEAIQISGYILPLGNSSTSSQARTVKEFLLVPYVGACIHVPTPPPNQMVYVKPTAAIENPGIFSAVELTGKLRSHSTDHTIFRVDGSQTVTVSYEMDLDGIVIPSNPDASQIGGQITGPWWQTIPARVSNVLTVSLADLSRQTSLKTLAVAMTLSFGYGVLHTLGPGHGKAVIISYFVGNGGSIQRGILMGVRIAVFHVLSAVIIVVLTDRIVQQVSGSSASSYRFVQLLSYGAIALIGSWMLLQALQKKDTTHIAPNTAQTATAAEAMLYPSLSQQLAISESTSPETTQQNKTLLGKNFAAACNCLSCGDPQGIGGWLSLAVGAVPCSGALLVLLYGLANDLLWQSVAMVIAISLGMAFTLAWIGSLAIYGNRYGQKVAARRQQKQAGRTSRQLSKFSFAQIGQVAGAICVSLLGTGLFLLTLATGT